MGPNSIESSGADTPTDQELIEPSADDEPVSAALARPHQDGGAHPVENTHSLMGRVSGALSSAAHAVGDDYDRATAGVRHWETVGPSWGTIASDIPHAIGAEVSNIEAGVKEGYGAWQSSRAEQRVAALNVLPQVAARTAAQNPDQQVALMTKDPLVAKTARTLGIAPADFAAQWTQYRDYTDDQRASLAQQAQQKLTKAQQLEQSGSVQRRATFASEQQWQPKDVAGNPISAWTLKGLAFHAATGLPDTVSIGAAALGGAALGGAPGGLAAGSVTAIGLMAPQQYVGIQNKIDQRLDDLKATAANADTPAARNQALQAATDLAANRDKIARTATILYGISDIAGSLPVASVLSRVPGGRAVLNRMVGAALAKTVGGRIAGFAVANGAAGLVQGAIQKGVDTGIIGERQPLSDALKDIAYSGVISAITGAAIGGFHEAVAGPIGEPVDKGRELGERVMRAYEPDQQQRLTGPSDQGSPADPQSSTPAPGASRAAAPADQPANLPVENAGGADSDQPKVVPAAPDEHSPKGAAAARTDFQRNAAIAQDAAARAQQRSDIQLEQRGDQHHIVVDGESVARFASKANAQEVLADARKLVGTAPAAAQEAATPAQPAAAPPAATETIAAQAPPAAAGNAARANFEERTTALQDAAARAAKRSDIQLEERDGQFHVTIGGQPVTSFASKANAQAAVAQARRIVGTASTPETQETTEAGAGTAAREPELHPVTGLPTRAAYEAAPKQPVQIVLRPSASEAEPVLQAVARIAGQDAFHLPGNHFVLQARSADDADEKLGSIQQALRDAEVDVSMPDGHVETLQGLSLEHGSGQTFEEAQSDLARRRTQQPSAEETAGAGREDHGGTTEVLGQEVAAPETPKPAQAESGNYRKPALDWNGLTLRVENLPGSQRAFKHPDGTPGTRTMQDAYGYVQSTRSADGEGLDVFMGQHPESKHVYVVDQVKPDGTFDEHKALVGYRSQAEAEHAYRRNYQKGWRGMGAVTELTPAAFRHWVEHGDLTQPLALTPKGKPTHVAYVQHGPELVEHAERAGWAEVGGKLLRQADTGGLKPEATGRTKWLPREPWFALLQRAAPLPKNTNGEATREAVRKAIAGEKLTAAERRHVDELVAIVRTRALSARELERLSEHELAEYHARMRDLYGRVGQQLKLYGGSMRPAEAKGAGGAQPDLFGDRREIANQLERVRAEMQRRERSAPAPGSAIEPDLFNDAGNQVDIEQALTDTSKLEHGQDAYRERPLALDFGHGAEKITPTFAARPDTTAADVRLGLRAIRSLIPARNLRAGAAVLGDRIPREFVARGSGQLVGRPVRGTVELAQLAQIYRDPRFETLRVILVKNGTVVDEIAMSSRLPGAASFVVKDGADIKDGHQLLQETMARTGADGYYLLHNHPSGRPAPSDADRAFTVYTAQFERGFLGHLVIDHGAYHVINERGDDTSHSVSDQEWKVGRNASVDHALLGQVVDSAEAVARVAMGLQEHAKNRVVVLTVTSSAEEQTVRSITAWPPEMLSVGKTEASRLRAYALARRLAVQSGGGWLFAVVPKAEHVAQLPRVFQDVVVAGQTESGYLSGRYKPMPRMYVEGLGRQIGASRLVREEVDQYGQPFYSALTRATETTRRERGTAAEWLGTLKNMPGLKRDELEYTGLEQWLSGRGRVSKSEVLDYLRAHEIHVQEVLRGDTDSERAQAALEEAQNRFQALTRKVKPVGYGDLSLAVARGEPLATDERALLEDPQMAAAAREYRAAYVARSEVEAGRPPAQFANYVLPGGRQYRELLLTLPPKPVERETHGRITALPNGLYRVSAPGLQDETFPTRAEAEAEIGRLTQMFGKIKSDQNYRSPHWSEPNVLAHVRFDERRDTEGRKVLHLAEVQSDWHQKGRKGGYRQRLNHDLALDHIEDFDKHQWHVFAREPGGEVQRVFAIGKGIEPTMEGARAYAERHLRTINTERMVQAGEKVPDAPFKTTWPELAMKRMLRFSAEHGFDRMTWDSGDTNAARYDLSKHISSVVYNGSDFVAYGKGGEKVIQQTGVRPEDLPDLIGKDAADKLLAKPRGGFRVYGLSGRPVGPLHDTEEAAQQFAQTEGVSASLIQRVRTWAQLEGLELKVGGEGMRAFYDQMLPSITGKLVKRFNTSVKTSHIPTEKSEEGVSYGQALEAIADGKRVVLWDDGQTTPIRSVRELEEIQNRDTGEEPRYDVVGAASADVHGVDITPELAAHVMRGQAVFEQRAEYGAQPEPGMPEEQTETPTTRAGYELARRAIADVPKNEFALWARRLLDPANVSPESKATALIARESLGGLAQATHESVERLEAYSRQFDLLSPTDRLEFIDAIETGRSQPRAELQGAADVIRSILDTWRDHVRELGVGALDNFIENYFPHIWADPSAARRAFAKVAGHRPLRGPATFLKQRKIPTMREGMALGLRPVTTNPLTLTFLKVREMQRFAAGVKLMQRLRDSGLAIFLPSHKPMPEGWTEIKDAVGRVRQWSQQEQGFIERGRYIMPEDAARVINNQLSTSKLARVAPVQLVRSISNAVNALQLGFSAFHLGFTTLDAVISKNALAVERLLHGEPIGALRAFMEAATGPGAALANIRRGAKLLKAYSNIAGAAPELRRIVEGLIAAGGRVKMDNYFQAARGVSPFRGVGVHSLSQDIRAALTQPHHRFAELTKATGSFALEYPTHLWRELQSMAVEMPAWRLPFEIAGRVTRASSAWIMEHIVPLQKLGVFADMAADHIQRHPLEGSEEFARAMQSIWNSVDNRLGEMVYDNLFWDRTWKDITHLTVRAVGWNLGTIREIGGAPVDAVRLIGYLARGAPIEGAEHAASESPEGAGAEGAAAGTAQRDGEQSEASGTKWHRIADQVGHRIPYVIAMTATVAMLGATLQYLLTGEGPKELKDYFFPRTGRPNADGSPERISLPAYVKDIYEYWHHPAATIANKANPLIGLVYDIWNNRDYYGDAIRNPDSSLWEQTLESARYAAREVLPFSVQGARKFQGAGEVGIRGKALQAAPFIGVTPAPSIVTNPEQGERYDREHDQQAYLRGLTQHLRKAQRQGDQEQVRALRQEIQQERLRLRETEREIRRQRSQAAADRISAIIQGKSRAQAVRALRAAGHPAFAQLWASMPVKLPERVATALRTFDQKLS
ncbi:MAG TPA: JAB domain-containing protein [Steroidobacteraceae bacterium]|nr:JAB domain-containing protein [Steroidobacteraceae bacterium]